MLGFLIKTQLNDSNSPSYTFLLIGFAQRKRHFRSLESLRVSGRQYRAKYREYLAEFIGTCILIILICGASAEQTLHVEPNKSWLTSSIGSGNHIHTQPNQSVTHFHFLNLSRPCCSHCHLHCGSCVCMFQTPIPNAEKLNHPSF